MAVKTSTAIELPPLAIETLNIPIIGDSPLIVHAWSEKARKMMADKQQKKASVGREAKDPWADFVGSMYWLDTMPSEPTEADVEAARFGFPTIGFKAAAVTACTSVASLTKVATRQAFHVEGEFAEIFGPAPSMREDIARVGMGVADLRYRGEFSPWGVVLKVKVNTAVMSPAQIVSLFDLAGFAVGCGDWRPERNGPFGRFHVAKDGEAMPCR